jgi:hypothetical protein
MSDLELAEPFGKLEVLRPGTISKIMVKTREKEWGRKLKPTRGGADVMGGIEG